MIFGSYRHWGHPLIEYKTGLKIIQAKLFDQRSIDQEYANALASDLSLMLLQWAFKKYSQWFVDKKSDDSKPSII